MVWHPEMGGHMTDIIRHTCTYRVTDLQKYLDSVDRLDLKLGTYGVSNIHRIHLGNNVFNLVCDIDHDHPENSKIMSSNEEYGWEYKMLEVPITQTMAEIESQNIIDEMKEVLNA